MLYYMCVLITCASALANLIFAVSALIRQRGRVQADTFYYAVRSVVLFGMAVVPLVLYSVDMLLLIALGMILTQVLDGIIGIRLHKVWNAIGPFLMAAVNSGVLFLLLYVPS